MIEAIPDNLALKQTLLQKLDSLVRADAILATSTNTLSITALAAATRLPGRVLGLHFCKPAYIMRLVEVVRGEHTRQDALDRAVEFARTIGKTPSYLPDTPGLLVDNRIAQAYCGKALHLLDDSSLDIPTVDRLMEAAGFPDGAVPPDGFYRGGYRVQSDAVPVRSDLSRRSISPAPTPAAHGRRRAAEHKERKGILRRVAVRCFSVEWRRGWGMRRTGLSIHELEPGSCGC